MEFFSWLWSRPCWKSEQQIDLLEAIENKVIEGGWDLDRLKRIKKQDWQDYGFGIGTFVRVCTRGNGQVQSLGKTAFDSNKEEKEREL
jgi:hypothetical protein